MANRRDESERTGSTRWSIRREHPLRRANDPTLLLGDASPLTTASVVAALVGVGLALPMSSLLAPLAFTLASVVAMGLLVAARRADIAMRPDYQPDRSPRSRRALVGIVALALFGTWLSAWTLASDWVGSPPDNGLRAAIATGLSVVAITLPLVVLMLFDALRARLRPSRQAVAADVPVAVHSDGVLYRADTEGRPLIVSDDMCEPAELPRGRRFDWRGLHFAVRKAWSPFRPPVYTVSAPGVPVIGGTGTIIDHDTVVGRVPSRLSSTWIFQLDPEATRSAARRPGDPDFFAAYGRLVLIRSSLVAPPVDLSGVAAEVLPVARTVRAHPDEDAGSVHEMLEFVEANVSRPRDLPRMHGRGDPSVPGDRALPAATDPLAPLDLDDLFADDDERGQDEPGQDDEASLAPDDSPADRFMTEVVSGATDADPSPASPTDDPEADPDR
jgi:hypothetical protein